MKVYGIKLLEEIEGHGQPATTGDVVDFDSQGSLSRGDLVQPRCSTRTRLGSRELIAGIEYSLIGMCEGGYKKVKISPHLAYREAGVPDAVPPSAVLIYQLLMNKLERKPSQQVGNPRP